MFFSIDGKFSNTMQNCTPGQFLSWDSCSEIDAPEKTKLGFLFRMSFCSAVTM